MHPADLHAAALSPRQPAHAGAPQLRGRLPARGQLSRGADPGGAGAGA